MTSTRPKAVTVRVAELVTWVPATVAVMVTVPGAAVLGAVTVPSEPTTARPLSEDDHSTLLCVLPSDMVTVADSRTLETKPLALEPEGACALMVAELGDTTTRVTVGAGVGVGLGFGDGVGDGVGEGVGVGVGVGVGEGVGVGALVGVGEGEGVGVGVGVGLVVPMLPLASRLPLEAGVGRLVGLLIPESSVPSQPAATSRAANTERRGSVLDGRRKRVMAYPRDVTVRGELYPNPRLSSRCDDERLTVC